MAAVHRYNTVSADTPVYRTTPVSTGTTASPAAGNVLGTELWAEVTMPGTTQKTYLLVKPRLIAVTAGDLADGGDTVSFTRG